jgi:hypothetical protein
MAAAAVALALPAPPTGPSTTKYVRDAEGRYVCPDCGKVTEKQNTMYYHMKKNHARDLPFECTKCESHPRFLQKSSYLHHVATHHPEDAKTDETNPYAGVSFACPGCEHTTHTKANMLIHYARTHCKEWIPPYSKYACCEGCSKTFASSSAYLYHAITCLKDRAPPTHSSIMSRIK